MRFYPNFHEKQSFQTLVSRKLKHFFSKIVVIFVLLKDLISIVIDGGHFFEFRIPRLIL